MALPDKKIKKIKLPGDVEGNKTYEIVPDKLSDGSTNFSTTLPTLTEDSTIALTSDLTGLLKLDGSNTMTGVLNLKATGNNESNIGANGIRWGTTSLPQDTAPQYICTIDGFANGGRQKWASIADLKTALAVTNYLSYSSTAVSSGSTKNYILGKQTTSSNSSTYYNSNVYFTNAGEITANTINLLSDARVKENLATYNPSKSILDLPVYTFDFKDSDLKNQIGCLAQDLQEIEPRLVDETDDGYLHIRETKLVYLLLNEVKKLNNKVNDLTTELNNLKNGE